MRFGIITRGVILAVCMMFATNYGHSEESATVPVTGVATAFSVPADWTKDIFFDALTVAVNELAAQKLPDYELKKSGRRLVLSWKLRECAVTRPKYFAGSDEKRIDHELAPVPEGVKLTVWLADDNLSQAMRPQTHPDPSNAGVLYTLLGQELPIPELKGFLFFNLEYGEATDKQLVRDFSAPQEWLTAIQRNNKQAGEPPTTREMLFGRLLSGLQREAAKQLPGYDLTLSGREIRIDWRLNKATVLFPAGKTADSGTREESGLFPIPAGLRLTMRLATVAAVEHAQLDRGFDRPGVLHYPVKTMDVTPDFTGQREGARLAWLYGAGGPYQVAGQMLGVVVDLEYGDSTDAELVRAFSSPARWLGRPVSADNKNQPQGK